MSGEADQPNPEFEPDSYSLETESSIDEREEILDSLLEQTRHELHRDGVFERLTRFVREARLPSKFSLENLNELVRFILSSNQLDRLPMDQEECITWVSNCLYDDPVANERASALWGQIIDKLQGNQ